MRGASFRSRQKKKAIKSLSHKDLLAFQGRAEIQDHNQDTAPIRARSGLKQYDPHFGK
jgi:hypothetical protein